MVSTNSPKKQANKFFFTTTMNLFVRFLGEFEDTKKPFQNYLTFSDISEIQPALICQVVYELELETIQDDEIMKFQGNSRGIYLSMCWETIFSTIVKLQLVYIN